VVDDGIVNGLQAVHALHALTTHDGAPTSPNCTHRVATWAQDMKPISYGTNAAAHHLLLDCMPTSVKVSSDLRTCSYT
jgi:hypothetical protein